MAQNIRYFFDRTSFVVKKTSLSIWHLLVRALVYMLVVLALTTISYIVFAMVVTTDSQRALRRENRMYEKMYPELKAREELLGDVIAGLQHKDNSIYHSVFNAEAPNVDPFNSLDVLFGSDTIPDIRLVRYTKDKSLNLQKTVSRIDANFERILRMAAAPQVTLPPMEMPLRDVSYVQIGASRGSHLNYNIKTYVQHDGLDVIAPQGETVYAPADGVVTDVQKSKKGQGNVVELKHDGGYYTRYAHLHEIFVSKGETVRKGKRIGAVGMSGSAFAPHLHYEVRKDSLVLDPVHYLFASVSPDEYANVLFMAVNTVQSMD